MKKYLLLLSTVLIAVTGCAPIQHTRGNLVDPERQENIVIGQSTKTDVTAILGTPTTTSPFDNNTWYYVGEKTERFAFFDADIKERKVLTLVFDQNGVLQEKEEKDKDSGQDIDIVSKETPTSGLKMNVLQQFVGNIGRFNKKNDPVPTTDDR